VGISLRNRIRSCPHSLSIIHVFVCVFVSLFVFLFVCVFVSLFVCLFISALRKKPSELSSLKFQDLRPMAL